MSIASGSVSWVVIVCVTVMVVQGSIPAAALPTDDDRYVEREYVYSSPGFHELATNLLAQLRQTANSGGPAALRGGPQGCGFVPQQPKRNSELINSLLGLPKQVSNGRK